MELVTTNKEIYDKFKPFGVKKSFIKKIAVPKSWTESNDFDYLDALAFNISRYFNVTIESLITKGAKLEFITQGTEFKASNYKKEKG